QDARIRDAFELSIDRDVINDVVFSGLHIPTNQWFPPDDEYYSPNLPMVKRDVERARKMLADIGVPHPKLELMLLPPPEYRQMAEILRRKQALLSGGASTTVPRGGFDHCSRSAQHLSVKSEISVRIHCKVIRLSSNSRRLHPSAGR